MGDESVATGAREMATSLMRSSFTGNGDNDITVGVRRMQLLVQGGCTCWCDKEGGFDIDFLGQDFFNKDEGTKVAASMV